MGNKVWVIKTNSKPMCSLCIDSADVYLHLFCIYMPCDINTQGNIDEYDNVLAEISAICINNNAMYICIAEDYNTAFDREQAWHTHSLKQFMSPEILYVELILLNHVLIIVQYVFMPDRGTRNAIFVLRRLVEHPIQKQKDVLTCFIDYSKAFETVKHASLFDILSSSLVPILESTIISQTQRRSK